jgi:hypothetical protein
MYAGAPKLDDYRRHVLLYDESNPDKDNDMLWEIEFLKK